VEVFKAAYLLAMKEYSNLSQNNELNTEITQQLSPTREQLLDEESFLGLLHRAATVLNPGFQAAVLERIYDHLYNSLPDGLLQGGPAKAEDFFRNSDLFLTECVYVDPSVHPSQPACVAATASLGWHAIARPQAENASTQMAGVLPTFSRAKSAGHEVRPALAEPGTWRAQETAVDSKAEASTAAAITWRAGELPEAARAGSSIGFTRSRSAADGEEAVAAGKLAGSGWDVASATVFTRSRSAADGEEAVAAGKLAGSGWDLASVFTRSRYLRL
jgi:hypothetical protein